MSWLLWRSSLRYLQHHAWQVGLALLGVALGVAVVVAIDVANESARRAFVLATQSIVGRATHQIVGGPNGVAEEVYRRLRLTGKVRALAPVVESDVAATDYPGRIFHLLGVDAFAEAPFRPYLSSAGAAPDNDFSAFLTQPATGLIAARTARQLGLAIGDRLSVRAGTRHQAVTLVGLLDPPESRVASAVEHLLITDIATAQEILGLVGQLSRIDVLAPEGEAGQKILATIRQLLPAGVEILSSRGRSQAIEQMTRAFQLNLTALSLLALIVGAFLIYNTMTFSVVQRRSLLGLLRTQGVTRGEICLLVLGEAAFMGGVGTVAGIGLGILLSHGLVQLVTRTITDLYFVLTVRELALTPVVLGKGMALGIGASLLAALRPAWEATATTPARDLAAFQPGGPLSANRTAHDAAGPAGARCRAWRSVAVGDEFMAEFRLSVRRSPGLRADDAADDRGLHPAAPTAPECVGWHAWALVRAEHSRHAESDCGGDCRADGGRVRHGRRGHHGAELSSDRRAVAGILTPCRCLYCPAQPDCPPE